jgi:hypothetical protein
MLNNKISRDDLIALYEKLMLKGSIRKRGSASRRCHALKTDRIIYAFKK